LSAATCEVTGGPTLPRHRVNDAVSPTSSGANHVTAVDGGAGSSAVLRATIEVLATHPGEAPPTNKRKEKKYRLQPARLKRGDLIKIVPLE